MAVICYPSHGKQKSYDICAAFAKGCGGSIYTPALKETGEAFFFGVTPDLLPAWDRAEHYYYGDNSYFDCSRGTHFRVTEGALQLTPESMEKRTADYDRMRALGLKIKPWRLSGSHILVVPQSIEFMRFVGTDGATWLNSLLSLLRKVTDREVRVRVWSRDKKKLASTLHQDFRDCWAVVAHTSAALNEAVLAGIPVVATGPCPAAAFSRGVESIENPTVDADRERWAAVLAANQWTIDEMRSGKAWKDLCSR